MGSAAVSSTREVRARGQRGPFPDGKSLGQRRVEARRSSRNPDRQAAGETRTLYLKGMERK